MKIRNIVSAAAACAVAAAAFVMPASAEDTYVAGLTWQSSSYMFRNTISQSSLLYWDNDLGEAAELEGASFTDAQITGDGTYTVTLDGVQIGGSSRAVTVYSPVLGVSFRGGRGVYPHQQPPALLPQQHS